MIHERAGRSSLRTEGQDAEPSYSELCGDRHTCKSDTQPPPLQMTVTEPQQGRCCVQSSLHRAWLASLGQNFYCEAGKIQDHVQSDGTELGNPDCHPHSILQGATPECGPGTHLLGVPMSSSEGPTTAVEPRGTLTRFMMKYSSIERYTMKKTQDQGFRE